MNLLTLLWFTVTVSGAIAGLIAIAAPRVRQPALMVAGVSFGLAGILGIFSIGILFIGLAALCFYHSRRSGQPQTYPLPPPPTPAVSSE